jgi:hypothetical protein
MTANELADAIEKGGKDGFFQDEIIAILRQQQAEIEALHNLVKEQEKKIIDLAFDLEYANRTDEFHERLTDEEIVKLYKETEADNGGIREFARAILEKASEKND